MYTQSLSTLILIHMQYPSKGAPQRGCSTRPAMPPAKEYGATSTGGSAAGFQEFDDFDDPFEQPPAPKQRARPTAAPARPKPASRRSLPPPVPQAAEEEEEERPQRKASSARSPKKAGDKKRKRCAVPARTHMAVMGGVAVVLCVAFFMFKAPSTGTGPSRMGAMLISLGLRGPSFPSNVLVTGCGLGNRLVSVGSFLEAGKEAGQTAGIVWGTSVAMSAQWSELFKTPLPEVKPAELAKTNYRWTSTEYAKDPLAVRTLANGRSFKSSTGHYAELAGLDDAKFSALPIESKPKVGGWAGLTPANTLTSVAKGDVSISVGCMARKFGTTPNSFLQVSHDCCHHSCYTPPPPLVAPHSAPSLRQCMTGFEHPRRRSLPHHCHSTRQLHIDGSCHADSRADRLGQRACRRRGSDHRGEEDSRAVPGRSRTPPPPWGPRAGHPSRPPQGTSSTSRLAYLSTIFPTA